MVAPGGAIPFAGNIMRVAEGEFAFVFGEDLPPRDADYSEEEVMRTVATLHPCIETPDSRFAVFTAAGEPQLAADTACAGRFVLGPRRHRAVARHRSRGASRDDAEERRRGR